MRLGGAGGARAGGPGQGAGSRAVEGGAMQDARSSVGPQPGWGGGRELGEVTETQRESSTVPGVGSNPDCEQRDRDRIQLGQASLELAWMQQVDDRDVEPKKTLAEASYLVFAALAALQAGQDLALNGLDPKLSLLRC